MRAISLSSDSIRSWSPRAKHPHLVAAAVASSGAFLCLFSLTVACIRLQGTRLNLTELTRGEKLGLIAGTVLGASSLPSSFSKPTTPESIRSSIRRSISTTVSSSSESDDDTPYLPPTYRRPERPDPDSLRTLAAQTVLRQPERIDRSSLERLPVELQDLLLDTALTTEGQALASLIAAWPRELDSLELRRVSNEQLESVLMSLRDRPDLKLQHLCIGHIWSRSYELSDEGIEALCGLVFQSPHLRTLELTRVTISRPWLSQPRLGADRRLKIRKLHLGSDSLQGEAGVGSDLFQRFPKLQHLYLGDMDTPHAVSALAHCRQLKRLHFAGNSFGIEASRRLRHIPAHAPLRALGIHYFNMARQSAMRQFLERVPNLESLKLSLALGGRRGDGVIPMIDETLPQLKRLDVEIPSGVAPPRLSQELVTFIRNHPQLQSFRQRYSPVSTEVLDELMRCEGLEELGIELSGPLDHPERYQWPSLTTLNLRFREDPSSTQLDNLIAFVKRCPHLQRLVLPRRYVRAVRDVASEFGREVTIESD